MGRLAAHAKRLANIPLCELVFLFGPWILLSHNPGRPTRERISTNPRTFWLFLWQVLSMEMLRSRSPLMIRKELRMFAIGYNLVRLEMARAAVEYGVALDRISFKGTIQTILETAPTMAAAGSQREHDRRHKRMLRTITKDLLPNRPNRVQPRAIKRRPKQYQLLNIPRHQFQESPHRNKYQATLS